MFVTGSHIATDLADAGSSLPAGHVLVTLAERPDLVAEVERFGSSGWPELMHHDPVSPRCWPLLHSVWHG